MKKKVLFSTLVLSLFIITTFPFSTKDQHWLSILLTYISGYLFLGLLLLSFLSCYQSKPVQLSFNSIGHKVNKLNNLPEKQLICGCALLFFLLTLFLSGYLFDFYPADRDSMAQYAGAKIFLTGQWTLISHPLKEFFNTPWFVNDGHFYTFYPPGHMLLLSLGHSIGYPQMINPFIGSLGLIATYYLTKEVGGSSAAKIALFLYLCSPFIVFLSSEYDNRSTALLCTTLFSLFYIRALKNTSLKNSLFAGLFLGYMVITRPQTGFLFFIPFLIYSLYLTATDYKKNFKLFLVMACTVIPFLCFFLYYNWQTTGNALLSGYQKYFGNEVLPGIGFYREGHFVSWFEHYAWLTSYMRAFDEVLFYWPYPSLIFALLLFFFNADKPYCKLLASTLITLFFGLSFSPYVFFIFGPRYLYEASSIYIALTAIALTRLPAMLRKKFTLNIPKNHWRGLIATFLCLSSAIALVKVITIAIPVYKNNYRYSNKTLIRKIEHNTKKPALVILQHHLDKEAVIFLQPWSKKNEIIVASGQGNNNKKLINYYKNRNIYLYQNNQLIKIH